MFAEAGVVAQDQLMAELKRVGTQQEALKKAVAEAISDAHAGEQSFSVPPVKSFVEPGKQGNSAHQDASPATPSIQAKWTNSPATSRQGSEVAAMSQPDSAAVQMGKTDEMDNRAESLQEPYRRDQFTPAAESVAAPQPTPMRTSLLPELIAEAGVQDSRSALARMQVALGGHDDSGKAAFNPSQYTFDKLPSQGGTLVLASLPQCMFCALYMMCVNSVSCG